MFRIFVCILLFAGSYAFFLDSITKLHCVFSKYMLDYFDLNEIHFGTSVQQNAKSEYDHLSLQKYGENLQKQGVTVMAMLDELRQRKYSKFPADLMMVNLYINNMTGNIQLYAIDKTRKGKELVPDDCRTRHGFYFVYKMITDELKSFRRNECERKCITCMAKIDSRFENLKFITVDLKYMKESNSLPRISYYLDLMVRTAQEAFKENIEKKTYEDFHPSNMIAFKLMNRSKTHDGDFDADDPLDLMRYVSINADHSVHVVDLFEKIKFCFHGPLVKSYQQQVLAASLHPIFSCATDYVRMFKQLHTTGNGVLHAAEISDLGSRLIRIFQKIYGSSFLPYRVAKYIYDITDHLQHVATYHETQQGRMAVKRINVVLSLLSKPMELNGFLYDSSNEVLEKISEERCTFLIKKTNLHIEQTSKYTEALLENVAPLVILKRSVNHEDMFKKKPLDVLNTSIIGTIYYDEFILDEESSNMSKRPSHRALDVGKNGHIGRAGALSIDVTTSEISNNSLRIPWWVKENERRKGERHDKTGGSSHGIIDDIIHAGESSNSSVNQPSRHSSFREKEERIGQGLKLDETPSTATAKTKPLRVEENESNMKKVVGDSLEKMDGSNENANLIISQKNENDPIDDADDENADKQPEQHKVKDLKNSYEQIIKAQLKSNEENTVRRKNKTDYSNAEQIRQNIPEQVSLDCTEVKKTLRPSGETEGKQNKSQYTTKNSSANKSEEWLKRLRQYRQLYDNNPKNFTIPVDKNQDEKKFESVDKQRDQHKVKELRNKYDQMIIAQSKKSNEEKAFRGKKKICSRESDELDGKNTNDNIHQLRRTSVDWDKNSSNETKLRKSMSLYENRSRELSKKFRPQCPPTIPIKKENEQNQKSEIKYKHSKANLSSDGRGLHDENTFHKQNNLHKTLKKPRIRSHAGDSTWLHCLFSEYLLGYLDINERHLAVNYDQNTIAKSLDRYDSNLRSLRQHIMAMLDELRNYDKNKFAQDLMTVNLYVNNLVDDLTIISTDITTVQLDDAESRRNGFVVNRKMMTRQLWRFTQSNCRPYPTRPNGLETRFDCLYRSVRDLDKTLKTVGEPETLQTLKNLAHQSLKPSLDRGRYGDFLPANMLFFELMLPADVAVVDRKQQASPEDAEFNDDGLQAIRQAVVISTGGLRRGGSRNTILAAFYCVSLNFNADHVKSFQQQVLAATVRPVFDCVAKYVIAINDILFVHQVTAAAYVPGITNAGSTLLEVFAKFVDLHLFSAKAIEYLTALFRRVEDVVRDVANTQPQSIADILSLCSEPMKLNRLEFDHNSVVVVRDEYAELIEHTTDRILTTRAYVHALSTHRHLFDVIERSVSHDDMFEKQPLDVFCACDSAYETDESENEN